MRSFMFIAILLFTFACIGWTSWCLWRILPLPLWGKWAVSALYLGCFLLFFVRYAWRNTAPLWLGTVLYEVSTSWLIFFLYVLLLFVVLYLGRLLNLVPQHFLKDSAAGTFSVLGTVALLLCYGYFHYHHKYREEKVVVTEKSLEKPLTLVLASDLHLGYHNRKGELQRWMNLFKAEKPDLVLLAGDILDGDIRPVNEWRMWEEFRTLGVPVYACLGNHEYISGKDGSEAFYAKAGIELLKDTVADTLGIRIIGRDDRSNSSRMPLEALCPAPDSLFTLLLDHQPYQLEQAEKAGIDFQFSGHTHHGQIWPGNWLTDLLFEKAYGSYQRGPTRYYITSGLGIWGGKFRIGTRSEYLVLKLVPADQ